MTFIIPHVTQTEAFNCVSACLAVILNRPIGEITAEFHDAYHKRETEVHDYLKANKMQFRHCMACEGEMFDGCTYLVAVPSLNIPSGLHQILLQREVEGLYLMDPNTGREGRKAYGEEIPLGGYLIEYEITTKAIEARYA